MKYYAAILLFLLSVTAFYSQDNKEIRVEYKMFCDTDVPLKYQTLLWIKNNTSIYQEKSSTTERWVEKPTQIEIDPQKLKSDYEPYIKTDNIKKEILFFDAIGKNILVVKDIYIDLKWKISSESKIILGYNCIKATTIYRGREWEAWFTPDVPLPFGPWKLHGLLGLILQANDSTNMYAFAAVKIENVKSDIFDKEFYSLMDVKSKKAIDIKKFIADQEEARENVDKMLTANDSDGVTLKVKREPRNGLELIYEWEE